MNNNIKTESLTTLRSTTLHEINLGKKRTHTFNVDYTDINPEFQGTFKVHYPSQLEVLRIGVLKSELTGGMAVDVFTGNIAHISATLDTVLDSKPTWFDIENPELDYEILEAIFIEYQNWVDTFRKQPKTTRDEEHSTDRGSQVSMVDTKDIQDSTNRQ